MCVHISDEAGQNSAYHSFSFRAVYSRRILLDFFYLAVVDRTGLGEGKDAQRQLHKAVVLLPSSEVPPPRDITSILYPSWEAGGVGEGTGPSPARAWLGRVGLGCLDRNEITGVNEASSHTFSGRKGGPLCLPFSG